jgi:hypothetical protein
MKTLRNSTTLLRTMDIALHWNLANWAHGFVYPKISDSPAQDWRRGFVTMASISFLKSYMVAQNTVSAFPPLLLALTIL